MALAGLAIKEVLDIVLKIIGAVIAAKMLMVAFATLLVEKGKFLLQLKNSKEKQDHKVIYYEDTHHDHHYEDMGHGGSGWLK